MKILERFFARPKEPNGGGDITESAKEMGKLLDKAAIDIFSNYRDNLLEESNVFIVPAVWGVVKGGELTVIQQEIYTLISPVIKETFELLKLNDLDRSQEFAIGFLIRGYLIAKILYMVEMFKNQVKK
jgi:hypothetical protein